MTTIINTRPTPTPDVVCDFGWYYGGQPTRLGEYFYSMNGNTYPPSATTLSSNATLDPTNPTGHPTIAVNDTATSVFEASGQVMVQNAAYDWALVRYTGYTLDGLSPYNVVALTGCTVLATSTGAAITFSSSSPLFDPRFYVDQTPLQQSITFDTIDQQNIGLPTTIVPNGLTIVKYEWDFGNGSTGSGPFVSTTYNYNPAPPNLVAKLIVIDSLNRRFSCAHPVNLQPFTQLYGGVIRS